MTHLSEMSIYENIRTTIAEAQRKVYSTVNVVMVEAYWNIGKQICEAQGNNDRAEYGAGLLKYLSEKLTIEFGKGFTVTNLSYMRQFYLVFPIRHALRDELSWTHYRMLLKLKIVRLGSFILMNVQNLIGVPGNWNAKSIPSITNDSYQVETRKVSELRFRLLKRALRQKT